VSILEFDELRQWRGRIGRTAVWVLVPVFGLCVAGCSNDRLLGRSDAPAATGSASSSPSFGDRVSNLFSGKPAPLWPNQKPPGDAGSSAQEIDCPTVAIRPGTSTFAVSTPGAEPSALNLRYQASFGQTARECKLAGTALTIRVGIEGRVVLGPAGAPSQVEIPIRYAVVQEGPDPKTIMTKLHWQSVTIPPGETNVPFTQIEEELTFPMPRGNALEAYVVYIGFDRAAVKEPEKKKPLKKPAPVARRAN
jgi:hypothetical protein